MITEEKWLASTDPMPMVDYLLGWASDRRLRLLIAAFCRQVWHLLATDECRELILLSERFADDQSFSAEMRAMAYRVQAMGFDPNGLPIFGRKGAAYGAAFFSAFGPVSKSMETIRTLSAKPTAAIIECETMRETFGNPFRPKRTGSIGYSSTGRLHGRSENLQ